MTTAAETGPGEYMSTSLAYSYFYSNPRTECVPHVMRAASKVDPAEPYRILEQSEILPRPYVPILSAAEGL